MKPLQSLVVLLLAVACFATLDSSVKYLSLGISVLMAIWWMTEALPLTVTALLPFLLEPIALDDRAYQADRLHPTGRYRPGLGLGKAKAEPQAVRRIRDREVEVLHEGNPSQGKRSHTVIITSHGAGPLLRWPHWSDRCRIMSFHR